MNLQTFVYLLNVSPKTLKNMLDLLIIGLGTALIYGFAIVHTLKTETK